MSCIAVTLLKTYDLLHNMCSVKTYNLLININTEITDAQGAEINKITALLTPYTQGNITPHPLSEKPRKES